MDTTTRATDQPRSRTNTRTNTYGVRHRPTRCTVSITVAATVVLVLVTVTTVTVHRRHHCCCCCLLLLLPQPPLPPPSSSSSSSSSSSPFAARSCPPRPPPRVSRPSARESYWTRNAGRTTQYTDTRCTRPPRTNRRFSLPGHVTRRLSRSLMFWFTRKQPSTSSVIDGDDHDHDDTRLSSYFLAIFGTSRLRAVQHSWKSAFRSRREEGDSEECPVPQKRVGFFIALLTDFLRCATPLIISLDG